MGNPHQLLVVSRSTHSHTAAKAAALPVAAIAWMQTPSNATVPYYYIMAAVFQAKVDLLGHVLDTMHVHERNWVRRNYLQSQI